MNTLIVEDNAQLHWTLSDSVSGWAGRVFEVQ
jgi:hypothetical protein